MGTAMLRAYWLETSMEVLFDPCGTADFMEQKEEMCLIFGQEIHMRYKELKTKQKRWIIKGCHMEALTADCTGVQQWEADTYPQTHQYEVQNENVIPERNPHQPPISYPSRLNKEKLQDKTDVQVNLLKNKEKLEELANTPINVKCSAILFNKVLEKLGDPGKFLIPCALQDLEVCQSLTDSGASINMLPLSIYEKLEMGRLKPTKMTFELAKKTVLVHCKSSCGSVFGNEEVMLYTDKSSRNNSREIQSVHCINVIDFSKDKPISGSTTFLSDSLPGSSFPSSLPVETIDSSLEEFADKLSLIESFPSRNDDIHFDAESDVRELEYLLNRDPSIDSSLKDNIEEIDSILDEFRNILYHGPFDDIHSKKDSKMKILIDELKSPESNVLLPQLVDCDSTLHEDLAEIDTLPSFPSENKDKVFRHTRSWIPYDREDLRACSQSSNHSNSEEEVRVALDQLPRDATDILDILKAEQAPLHLWLIIAREYFKQGKIGQFRQILEEGSSPEIDEYYADVRYERIAILNALGAYYSYLGKIESKQREKEEHFILATQYYNKASRIDMHEPSTWVGKGQLLLAKGDVDQAFSAFKIVLDGDRDNIPALLGQACVEFNRGKYSNSLEMYKRVLQVYPRCPAAVRLGIGLCRYKLGQFERAKQAFERVLELDPENVEALVALGIVDLQSNEASGIRRAMEKMQRAFDVYPYCATALNYLANHFFFTGQHFLVEQLTETAVAATTHGSTRAHSYYNLARSYHSK
nr:protein CTR9 homolog [Tanacetum cinerariifolium]